MKVDLHNFFLHYDPKNPKHVAAVEQLEKDLEQKQPDLIEDESNWVRIFREKAPVPAQVGVLSVPYYPQTDNYRDANRTCNSSSCAMCLEYLKPGTLKGAKGDDAYVQKVFAIGDSTDHAVQTRVLEGYGVKSQFSYNLSFSDLDKSLSAGKPVVIGILHRGSLSAPTGGHMVVVIGKKGNDYVVNDPYGSLNDGYTGAVVNGKGAVYKRSDLTHRWLENSKDKTGWGRIFK
jgi:uncharacterized protein YvpB